MKAVLIATGESVVKSRLSERYPTVLLPLLNRPFLQHVIESLYAQGIREIDVIVGRHQEKVRDFLGSGERWGCALRIHAVDQPFFPFKALPALGLAPSEEPVLLAYADRLADLSSFSFSEASLEPLPVALAYDPEKSNGNNGALLWSGWAVVSGAFLSEIPTDFDRENFTRQLLSTAQEKGTTRKVPEPLSVRWNHELLRSQRRVLSKEYSSLLRRAREVRPGIWLARKAKLHPSVKLEAPVFIGEGSRVEKDSQVGPFVVIGDHCVVDKGCNLGNTMVFEDTYLAERVELANVIADRDSLLDEAYGKELRLASDWVLKNFREKELHSLLGLLLARLSDWFRGKRPHEISKGRLAFQASLWLLLGHTLNQVLRLASNLVLVRFLYPGAFGLMALMNALVQGLGMCSDLGISQRVIQSDRGDNAEFLNTAWTLQAARGFLLCLVANLLARPLAQFYSEPALASYLPVLGFCLFVSGFNGTSSLTLRRRLQLKKLFFLDLAEQLASLIVMILWAVWSPSVWALVAGTVTASLVRLAGSHFFLARPGNRFHWDPQAVRAFYDFGKWIFVSSTLAFLAGQTSRLLLGRLVPLDLLGVFSIAMMVALFPCDLASRFSEMVIYPLFSEEARNSPRDLPDRVYETRKILWPFFFAVTLALALGGGLFFGRFYPEAYHEAGWMSEWLALWVWFSMIQMTTDRALLAAGRTPHLALLNVVKFAVTIAATLWGFQAMGMQGFILGLVTGVLSAYAVTLFYFPGGRLRLLKQDLVYTFSGLGIAGLLRLIS